MNENAQQNLLLLIALGLAGVCLLICLITWYPVHMLEVMREEYDNIESERGDLNMTVENFEIIKDNLEKLEAITPKDIKPAADIVEFYAYVRQAAENNGINIISTKQDNNSITMNLQGGYYSLMHLIADWRKMPASGKITSIKIQRDKDVPALFVTADVTLAALLDNDNNDNNSRQVNN